MNLKDCRLLVTPTSYGKNDARLKTELEAQVGEVIYNPTGKPLTSTEVAQLLPGIDGYIAGLDGIDANALKTADRLKVIARYGVGVDNVDLAAAREKGIVVTNTPGANSVSVAELALGLMLALARQIPEAVEAVHQGKFPRFTGVSLEGKTIGILGWARSENNSPAVSLVLIARSQPTILLLMLLLQKTIILRSPPWMK